jgi:hypothetical protein
LRQSTAFIINTYRIIIDTSGAFNEKDLEVGYRGLQAVIGCYFQLDCVELPHALDIIESLCKTSYEYPIEKLYFAGLALRYVEETYELSIRPTYKEQRIHIVLDIFIGIIDQVDPAVYFEACPSPSHLSLHKSSVLATLLVAHSLTQDTWNLVEEVLWKRLLNCRAHTQFYLVECFKGLAERGLILN